MKKVDCPLMDECVDDAICFDIHMVVEGCAPKFTAPKKAVQTPDFKENMYELSESQRRLKATGRKGLWYFYTHF